MLKNYITDSELKKYHPLLANDLWSTQSSYSNQINEAFERLFNDLHNLDINPRLLMTPFDLKGSTTGFVNFPSVVNETTSTTGDSKLAVDDLRRIVVDVNSISGTWYLNLQGSNNGSGFEDISNASITSTLAQVSSSAFTNQYKYYRLATVSGTTGNVNISYSAYLVENIFDKAIIYKTFSIIFGDFSYSDNDRWDKLKKDNDKAYESTLASIKYLYDFDESGSPQQNEVNNNNYTLWV